jgi:hypothetical protein
MFSVSKISYMDWYITKCTELNSKYLQFGCKIMQEEVKKYTSTHPFKYAVFFGLTIGFKGKSRPYFSSSCNSTQ